MKNEVTKVFVALEFNGAKEPMSVALLIAPNITFYAEFNDFNHHYITDEDSPTLEAMIFEKEGFYHEFSINHGSNYCVEMVGNKYHVMREMVNWLTFQHRYFKQTMLQFVYDWSPTEMSIFTDLIDDYIGYHNLENKIANVDFVISSAIQGYMKEYCDVDLEDLFIDDLCAMKGSDPFFEKYKSVQNAMFQVYMMALACNFYGFTSIKPVINLFEEE